MALMRPRERVLAALHHQQPDRVPLFYRATEEVTDCLIRHFGAAGLDDVLELLHVDFRFIQTPYIGPPRVPDAKGVIVDYWGIPRRRVHTATGSYMEPVCYPLAEARTPAEVRAHPWPKVEWFDFSAVREQMTRYTEYATMPAAGIGCDSPLGIMPELRGMENLLIDLVERREMFRAIVAEMMRFRREYLRAFLPHARGLIFLRVGEDFGSQHGLLFSPRIWDECIRPYFVELVQQAHKHGIYLYLHSCGAVRDLIPRLIAVGVDVLDPLQVGARGMEPAALKREFGARLTFCGGVDLQRLLSRGKPDDVRAGVRDLIRVMAPGGGFILGPTHNLQTDVPIGNIIAMYEAGVSFGTYVYG